MTSPGLSPSARPVAAACVRAVRHQELERSKLHGFRRDGAAQTCVRLRRETRVQLQAIRLLLHTLPRSGPPQGVRHEARQRHQQPPGRGRGVRVWQGTGEGAIIV